jgi:hypothetical protein
MAQYWVAGMSSLLGRLHDPIWAKTDVDVRCMQTAIREMKNGRLSKNYGYRRWRKDAILSDLIGGQPNRDRDQTHELDQYRAPD